MQPAPGPRPEQLVLMPEPEPEPEQEQGPEPLAEPLSGELEPQPLAQPDHKTKKKHGYQTSVELQRRLEARRYRGKWASVRGIAEDNAAACADGGFALPDGGWQALGGAAVASELVYCSAAPVADGAAARRFESTEVCVANVDTLSAAVELGDACALSFANADTPGGRYTHGGRAQEEDLCRLLPQLHPALLASSAYPLAPGSALITHNLIAARLPGSYERCASMGECTVITAAMPCGIADRRPKGGWANSEWAITVTLRIRAVLRAAAHTGKPHLVLGAFGCGAFGNPAGPVATIFREQLESPEFRGAFSMVVFAVFDPLGTGNLGPTRRELATLK